MQGALQHGSAPVVSPHRARADLLIALPATCMARESRICKKLLVADAVSRARFQSWQNVIRGKQDVVCGGEANTYGAAKRITGIPYLNLLSFSTKVPRWLVRRLSTWCACSVWSAGNSVGLEWLREHLGCHPKAMQHIQSRSARMLGVEKTFGTRAAAEPSGKALRSHPPCLNAMAKRDEHAVPCSSTRLFPEHLHPELLADELDGVQVGRDARAVPRVPLHQLSPNPETWAHVEVAYKWYCSVWCGSFNVCD